MPQITRECPHCRAEKVGFAYRSYVPFRAGGFETLMFMQCEGCGQAIVMLVVNHNNAAIKWVNSQVPDMGPIMTTYPQIVAHKSPADVPDPVKAAFLSGLDNLTRTGGANAAALMFRRAIEVSAKTIDPTQPKGTDLKKRIAALPDEFATPAMKAWAQHIRLEGNDAAHEIEEFSDADAQALHTFAEMFLTYAFTLPAMLKRATGA